MPARAAYAAADADVFPVDAHITALEPSSTALDIAIVMPRSLNEPVGFAPSNFRYMSSFGLIASFRFLVLTSGVPPSCRETTGVLSVTGRNSLYCSIIPFHILF